MISETGDRLASTLDHTLKPEPMERRLEVITGTGRRRQFSEDFKAAIVEETLSTDAIVSEVARRHGLTRSRYSRGTDKRAGQRCQFLGQGLLLLIEERLKSDGLLNGLPISLKPLPLGRWRRPFMPKLGRN